MFSPVPPTDPIYIRANFPREMSNGQGVVVSRRGIGRMGQDVFDYVDSNKGLKVDMWAYRADDVEKIGAGPLSDFWQVDLMFSPQKFADARSFDGKGLFHEMAANIAECLLRWPLGRLNPTQATSVRVGSFDAEIFTMNLPQEWKLRHG
jgi:hypothetical protein